VLLSLFCGAGGLDLGFEEAGFTVGLAFDKRQQSVKTYNTNRPSAQNGHCVDVRTLSLASLDKLFGDTFAPEGVIGGPPCQSFSQANRSVKADDPRHDLPIVFADLLRSLNERSPVKFFVFENVTGLKSPANRERLAGIKSALEAAGFNIFEAVLDASNYGTPQTRKRLIIVGINAKLFPNLKWEAPAATTAEGEKVSVRTAIGWIAEPQFFSKNAHAAERPVHPNHWCMNPKSKKFVAASDGTAARTGSRSFKVLDWTKPSITVAYGHREVHVHPNGHRRLSVFEGMLLQGFPSGYVLEGTLSDQIEQVSEAVPPKMAQAIAASIRSLLESSVSSGQDPVQTQPEGELLEAPIS